MSAPLPNAVQNNQRLFEAFARKLASDNLTVYTVYADKFSTWLSDERAYYPNARPEILKILKIAQATLRRRVGADLKNAFHISAYLEDPMVAPYSRLLRTINGFKDRFVEPNIHAEIKALLKTITAPTPIRIDLTVESPVSTPVLTPQKHGTHTTMQPSSSSLATALKILPSSISVGPALTPHATTHPTLNINSATEAVAGEPSPAPRKTHPGVAPYIADSVIIASSESSAPTSTLPLSSHTTSRQDISTSPALPIVSPTLPSLLPLKQNGSSVPPLPTSSSLPTPPATSKAKKKRKRRPDLGLETLIQADLQELQKRTATFPSVKQEPMEVTLPESAVVQGLTAEVIPPITQPQPHVVVILDHDEVANPLDLELRQSLSLNPASEQSQTFKDSSSSHPTAFSADETLPNEAGWDESVHMPPPRSQEETMDATYEEDIDMAIVTSLPDTNRSAEPYSSINPETPNYTTTEPTDVVADVADSEIIKQVVQSPGPPAHRASIVPDGHVDMEPEGVTALQEIESEDIDMSPKAYESVVEDMNTIDALGAPPLEDGVVHFTTVPSTEVIHSASSPTLSLLASVPPRRVQHTLVSLTSITARNIPMSMAHEVPQPLVPPINSVELILMTSCTDQYPNALSLLAPPSAAQPAVEEGICHQDFSQAVAPMTRIKEHTVEELKALYAFGPETLTFAVHKGLVKRCKAKIQFVIPIEQFRAVTLWSTRRKHNEDLKESICISLACYSRASVKTDTKTLDEVSSLPSIWPTGGMLSMNVDYKSKATCFPLSPPFVVAPNGLVDVSDFISSDGTNMIELEQLADMSAYIFILRAHHPTGAQIEQVEQRRQKNQAWKDWLLKMAEPMEVPIPTFT